jgi:hypothetical protein
MELHIHQIFPTFDDFTTKKAGTLVCEDTDVANTNSNPKLGGSQNVTLNLLAHLECNLVLTFFLTSCVLYLTLTFSHNSVPPRNFSSSRE